MQNSVTGRELITRDFFCYKLKIGMLEKSGCLNGAARLKLRVLAYTKRRNAFLKWGI